MAPLPQLIDLKQGRGGMVDIEFIAQYLVLTQACEAPELARWTDTMRILEAAGAADALASEQVHTLQRAWQHYRTLGHRLALQDRPARVPHEQVAEDVERVRALWAAILGDELI
jgi:glutamate-ammonia-ligase adenylyltransferase